MSQSKLSRRTLFAGAATAGTVAAVTSLMPGVKEAATSATKPLAMPAKGGGYTLSEHVKRYYKTTLI